MTLRHRLLPAAGILVVIAALVCLLALLVPTRADLVVVCSNTASACDALAEHYERSTRTGVDVVRVPTSEALSRLAATHGDSEFDVWLGGPAEAHAEAERLGLLRSVEGVDVSGLPEQYHSSSWFGVYGGILSICATPEASGPASSWDSLVRSGLPLIVPLPLTSGTAATMLGVHTGRFGSIRGAIPFLRALDASVVTYTDSGTDPAHLVAIGRARAGVTFDTYCDLERRRGAARSS